VGRAAAGAGAISAVRIAMQVVNDGWACRFAGSSRARRVPLVAMSAYRTPVAWMHRRQVADAVAWACRPLVWVGVVAVTEPGWRMPSAVPLWWPQEVDRLLRR
jgi:hypothetical protein